MNSTGNEVATPLRRLSSWMIDGVSFLLVGPAIFIAVGFLSLIAGSFLRDLPIWGHVLGGILFVAVIYLVWAVGWLLVLRLTSMNRWQIVAILSPTIVLFSLSIFSYLGSSLPVFYAIYAISNITGNILHLFVTMPVAVSLPISYIIWTFILFGNGQTIGKRLVGIQTVRQNGEVIGWWLMFVREILKSLLHLSLIGFIIDGVMLLSDKTERQSVADRIAGTVVVRI